MGIDEGCEVGKEGGLSETCHVGEGWVGGGKCLSKGWGREWREGGG